MNLVAILGILFVAFGIIYSYCLWWGRRQTQEDFEVKRQSLFAGVVYAGVFVTMAALMFFERSLPIGPYAFLMFACLGILYAAAKWPIIKYWLIGLPILCCIGTVFLGMAVPAIHLMWYEYILYALFWALFVGLFVIFDYVPCSSFLQGLIWGISAAIALLVPFNIPLFFSVLGSVLLFVIWSLSKVMVKWHMPNLGIYASLLFGFLWGALFTFALINHAVLPVILMLNCYIFALTFGLFLLWQVKRQIKISYVEFYKSLPPSAQVSTINAVLTRCGLLSCMGILLWHFGTLHLQLGFCVVALIIFLDLYNRLRDGGAPAPTIRQVISSMVQGIKVCVSGERKELPEMVSLGEEINELPEEPVAPIEEEKKSVVKKSTVSVKKEKSAPKKAVATAKKEKKVEPKKAAVKKVAPKKAAPKKVAPKKQAVSSGKKTVAGKGKKRKKK